MQCIEQTKQWIKEHQQAGRIIEYHAAEYRLKVLERCQVKFKKPDFVLKMYTKAEDDMIDFRFKAEQRHNGKPAMEVFLDDALQSAITKQAIEDFLREQGWVAL